MIQVIYRWRVKEGQEKAFTRAWTQGTRASRSACQGAYGSVLLCSHRQPSEYVGIATWERLEDVQAFWASDPPDPEAFRIVAETGTFLSREIFDEIQDLEL
jgi:heme-degrading monooxygenase HmoA